VTVDAANATLGADGNFQDGLPPPRRYIAVLAVSLGTVLTTVDGTIVNVALPTLARDLHVAPSAAVLVVTIYQLVLMMTVLPFSALGHRYGHRAVYQYGQMAFVAATVLCFFARSLPFLVLVRAFQALGAAAVLSVVSAMIRSIYPLSSLGRGLSLNTVVAASAASLAPTVGGAVLAVANWPWLFAIVVPFGMLSILIGRKSLPENKRQDDPYDVLGAVMCAATFGLTIFGLESAVHGDSPVVSGALVVMGIGLGVFFVRRELGQTRPVLPVDLLRLRSIALPSIGTLAAYTGLMMVMLTLPFGLQQRFHFTPAAAGAMLSPMPLMSTIVAPIAGLLSDRFRAGVLGGIGMAIGTIGMICLAFLPEAPNHVDILWRMAICGVGYGMFFSPNARQMVGSAPRERAAAAGALFSTIRGAAQTLGATTVAALLGAGVGFGSIPPLIAAVLAVTAGLCSLAVLRQTPNEPLPPVSSITDM
jgi:MFS transporter, DHA2 family, multidrug resistance protein